MNPRTIILFCFSFLTFIQLASQILTNSNLPIIVINTNGEEIPDEPKINGTMGIIFNTDGTNNHVNDPFNYFDGNIGIETRGNSTQDFDKKTYSIELRDAANEDLSVNLFGMGGEEDWILHSMVIDKSHIRIPMSFYFFKQMGHYASKWKYVELIVNEEYCGLYILTEKIKRDDDRIDIAKLDENDIAGDDVTGGYILRIDWLDIEENEGFESTYESQGGIPMTFQWYYPRADRIQAEQAEYIENWIRDFEDALFSPDYTNEQGIRYSDYLNLNTFTDFLLINELSKNSDGYKLSSFIHKDRDSNDGRLKAGPIWDFDQTYGVSTVCSSQDYTGWTYLQNQDDCEDLESMPMWWQRMMNDPVFQNRLHCRWTQFRNSFLHSDSIDTWVDTHLNLISEAIERNFILWDDFIGESIWIEPEPIPQTYPEEIVTLKSWVFNRLSWMDNNIPGNCADDITNVDDIHLKSISVYPNPGNSFLTIESNLTVPVKFQLYSINGISIVEGTINSNHHVLDISQLPDNIYFLRIGSRLLKVVKVKE